MEQVNSHSKTTEYLSFKQLIQGFAPYVREIKIYRNFVFFCMLIALLIGIYNRWNTKKLYEAEVSFMINEEQQMPSLSSAIGQFSGLLGMDSDINLQKILELSKSRRIAEKVFEAELSIDGKTEVLANHFINELQRTGKWAVQSFTFKEQPLKNFRFKNFDVSKFSTLENMALKDLHKHYQDILSTQVSEKTSIMKLTIQFTSEQIAFHLAHKLFEEMSDFYIDKMVEKQKETFDELRHKTDSLKSLLEKKVYSLAGLKDSYRASWLYQEDVPKTILAQEINMLQLVYGESLKNREMASFALEVKTPFIQAIDLPIMPLKSIQPGWIKSLLLALFYGFLFASAYLLIRKFYREQMAF